MTNVERTCHEFVDGIHTAVTRADFQRVAERTAHALGFRWFAYLGRRAGVPMLISSYPKSWTDRYFEEQYYDVDPVLHLARTPGRVSLWDGREARTKRSLRQRRLFDDALAFKIRTGVTVPIAAGFGQSAAFTLAVDDRSPGHDRLLDSAHDLLQLVGQTYHAHVDAKIGRQLLGHQGTSALTQRERECLTWTAQGKTMEEIGMILDVSARAVKFHLDNARTNLAASTLPHAVAVAFRGGLLT